MFVHLDEGSVQSATWTHKYAKPRYNLLAVHQPSTVNSIMSPRGKADITTYHVGAAEIASFAKIKYTRPTILSEQQSRRATQQKCNAHQSAL